MQINAVIFLLYYKIEIKLEIEAFNKEITEASTETWWFSQNRCIRNLVKKHIFYTFGIY